ncbi:hypothetical protein C8R45DRAFT_1179211 [Mycena sanguinolenta]|nr:hypothetical protein C8R45DRAFT_1179211 [Mycena sanguinolenta]
MAGARDGQWKEVRSAWGVITHDAGVTRQSTKSQRFEASAAFRAKATLLADGEHGSLTEQAVAMWPVLWQLFMAHLVILDDPADPILCNVRIAILAQADNILLVSLLPKRIAICSADLTRSAHGAPKLQQDQDYHNGLYQR